MKFRLSLFVPVLLPAACAHKQVVPAGMSDIDLLIGNVTVIDQRAGRLPEHRSLAVRGRRIVAVIGAREAACHGAGEALMDENHLDRGALDAMLAAVRARVAAREAEAH